jgi:hypothetical protein
MKKQTNNLLMWAGIAGTAYLLLRNNNGHLFGLGHVAIPPMKKWNGQLTEYSQPVVSYALSRGADTYADFISDKVGTPEGHWLSTLTLPQRRSAYYQGYIIPWLHGYWGGPGTCPKPVAASGECGNVPRQLRQDNRRGAREGIEGEG